MAANALVEHSLDIGRGMKGIAMLVLSRKEDESICIGGHVTLRVVRITSNRISVAIDAPDHVRIHRGELCASLANPEPVPSAPPNGLPLRA